MKSKKLSPRQDSCSLVSQATEQVRQWAMAGGPLSADQCGPAADVLLGISAWAQSSVLKSKSTRVGKTIFHAFGVSWSVM